MFILLASVREKDGGRETKGRENGSRVRKREGRDLYRIRCVCVWGGGDSCSPPPPPRIKAQKEREAGREGGRDRREGGGKEGREETKSCLKYSQAVLKFKLSFEVKQ